MFRPPTDPPDPPPTPTPRLSRRKSIQLPWSLSTRFKKIKKKDVAKMAACDEQLMLPHQLSTASLDEIEEQAGDDADIEAPITAQELLTTDSQLSNEYSADQFALPRADQVEIVRANEVNTPDADKAAAPDAGQVFAPPAAQYGASDAPEALCAAQDGLSPSPNQFKRSHTKGMSESGSPIKLRYPTQEVERVAQEIYDQTISETTFGMFRDWIGEKLEHYELAKKYIRELATDQGYKVERTNNPYLCELVREVNYLRPAEAKSPVICEGAPPVRPQQSPSVLRGPNHGCTFADPHPTDLPKALKRMRQDVVYPSHLSSPLSSPNRDFPPDTPDRPQPLRLSSRQSEAGNMTPTTAYRSATTPISSSPSFDPAMLSPIAFPRSSLIEKEIASHPLIAASVERSQTFINQLGTDDVFGIVDNGGSRATSMLIAGGSAYGPNGARRYASAGHEYDYAQGPYELSESDASSSNGEAESAHQENGDAIHDDEADTLHTYVGSDTSSILETASVDGAEETQVRYSYASASPAPVPDVAAAQRPTTRTSRPVRKRIAGPALATYSRALPMRSYESQANLSSTSGAQGGSSHNRTQSAGSLVRSHRPMSLAIAATASPQVQHLPIRSSSLRTNTIPLVPRSDAVTEPSRLSPHVEETSGNDIEAAGGSQGPHSGTSPMGLSGASSADAQATHTLVALHQAISAITAGAAHVKDLLEQTRARGDESGGANWVAMTTFERSWRADREELLIAIYGRMDVSLTDEEVEYIDLICMELRSTPWSPWLMDFFHEEEE